MSDSGTGKRKSWPSAPEVKGTEPWAVVGFLDRIIIAERGGITGAKRGRFWISAAPARFRLTGL